MKKIIIIVLGLIITSSLASFAQSPGGVAGTTVWAKVENNTSPTQIVFKDYSANLKPITPIALGNSFFNYNHSKSFNGNNSSFTFLSKIETLPNATVFVVNKPNPSSTDAMALLSTIHLNHQQFQLSTDKYVRPFPVPTPPLVPYNVNYPVSPFVESTYQRPNARINTLVWHNYNKPTIFNSFGVSGESTVSVGGAFGTTNAFNGDIAEVIMYPEALNDNQRLRVESYLGIKYGITLQPDVDYLSSKSSKVWYKENNGFFKNRIFGIGRDSNTSLYQRQSTSSHDLTNQLILSRSNSILLNNYPFSNTSNNITDQNFILMGDNGRGQTIDFQVINGITTMKRKWLVQNTGEEAHLFNTSIHYRPGITLGTDEAFWLIVDRNADNSAESTFSGPNIDYYPFITTPNTTFPNGGYASYTNLKWGADTKKFTQFTFGKGPRMIVTATVQPLASCEATTAVVDFSILGGSPAFIKNITGTQADGTLFSLSLPANSNPTFDYPLPIGTYQIAVTDSTGFTVFSSFTINGANPNVNITMESVYNISTLIPPTIININDFIINDDPNNYTIKWFYENDGITSDNEINIFDFYGNYGRGFYRLLITHNETGCESAHTFEILDRRQEVEPRISLFPNPSFGKFEVQIDLVNLEDINLDLYDATSKLLDTKQLKDNKTYNQKYELFTSGVYFLRVTSKSHTETFKIIIN
jgi:hypothetical protein